MKLSRLAAYIVLFVNFITIPTIFAQAPPLEGVQILEKAIAMAGGRQAWGNLSDFRASGSMSLFSSGKVMKNGHASLSGVGLAKFNLTARFDQDARIWIWRNGSGILIANGHRNAIGRHNLAALEGITLPIQRIIALLNNPAKTVQLIDHTASTGQPYRVRIVIAASDARESMVLGRPTVETDVLIDQQSFAVMGIEDVIFPNDNTRVSFAHRLVYADYQPVAGLQIPFSVTEEVSNQLTWNIKLASFHANAGAVDSDFDVK